MLKISIIIPTYNRATYIDGLLKSIEKQKYENYEVIILNNASNDNTINVVNSSPTNKRLINLNKNHGAYHGWNVGSHFASGDILIFIDDDCIIADGSIGEINKFFINNKETIGVVVAKVLNEKYTLAKWPYRYHANDLENSEFELGEIVWEGACAIKRNLFEKIGGWDELLGRHYQGLDLSYRIIKEHYKIYYLPSFTVVHHSADLKDEKKKSKKLKYNIYYRAKNEILIVLKYYSGMQKYKRLLFKLISVILWGIKKGGTAYAFCGLREAAKQYLIYYKHNKQLLATWQIKKVHNLIYNNKSGMTVIDKLNIIVKGWTK